MTTGSGMTKAQTRKLRFGQLAAFAWLLEGPSRCIVAGAGRSLRFLDFRLTTGGGVEEVRPDEGRSARSAFADSMGGSLEINLSALADAGFLTCSHSRAEPKDDTGPNAFWSFFDRIGAAPFARTAAGLVLMRTTKEGREWWQEAGAEQFRTMQADREADRAAVARTVIIGVTASIIPGFHEELSGRLPAEYMSPFRPLVLVRPTFTATVVKEGPARVHISDIRRIRPSESFDSLSQEARSPIMGNAPNEYVDPRSILADHASERLIARLVEIDRETVETYQSTVTAAVERMLPEITLLHDRLFQAAAMRDDLVRQAIEDDRAEPESHSEPTTPKPGR